MKIAEILKRLDEAFDYDREGPKSNEIVVNHPRLEPRAKHVIQDILNGATRDWVSVHYDISLVQISGYLYKARKLGLPIPKRLSAKKHPRDQGATKAILKLLLKDWNPSTADMRRATQIYNNDQLLWALKAEAREQLRQRYPGRFPDKKKRLVTPEGIEPSASTSGT